jgi:adhesin transport system outer membrane protein
MKTFLLATVSMVALTSVARAAEFTDDARPFSSIPAADWQVGHMGMQGGTAPSDALSTKTIAPGAPFRRHDSDVHRSHESAVAARAQVGVAPPAALSYAAVEARPRAFSINDAISLAVLTNPGVGEAAANRRATETALRQAQGFLLPQVRLDSSIGPEKFTEVGGRPPAGNGTWFDGKEVSVVVRQILFDGFASIHEVWRQSARVNASAFRVLERTELIALDAAEAYIDVVRFLRLLALANQNVATHEELFSNVQSRFSGGRAGEGDLQQALERVEAAKAAREEFRRGLDDARSKYRKVIGVEAINLRFPAPLRALSRSKDDALAVALRSNPTLLAAESGKQAAKEAFRITDGAFVPNVLLEGRASRGYDTNSFIGRRDDVSGKIVMSWDIFRGGQDAWRRAEMAERYTEETMRHARLQRDALEAIDKAWAARTITADRIAALKRQLVAERKTIAIYREEYEIGRRSLIDLLNAENQYFGSAVSLTSARGVIVFADYQLLAAMGFLLDYLRTAPPVEAAPLDVIPLGPVPPKLPPLIVRLPQPGPEPLDMSGDPHVDEAVDHPPEIPFDQRWPDWTFVNPSGAAILAKPGMPLAISPEGPRQRGSAAKERPADGASIPAKRNE